MAHGHARLASLVAVVLAALAVLSLHCLEAVLAGEDARAGADAAPEAVLSIETHGGHGTRDADTPETPSSPTLEVFVSAGSFVPPEACSGDVRQAVVPLANRTLLAALSILRI